MEVSYTDFTRHKINIDDLLDIVCSAQQSANHPVTLKEAKYNIMGMKIKNDDAYNDECNESKCGSCKQGCANRKDDKNNNAEKGKRNLWDPASRYADDDDEDDTYICDYCNMIGYSLKYSPDICDNCNKCEQCGQYEKEECDGCSYSVWRDGRRYGDTLSMEDMLSTHDIDIINRLSEDCRELNNERFTPTRFTVRKK